MARVVKDRFRDWNLLHKSVIALIVSFWAVVIAWAITVADIGFEMERDVILPYGASDIWPWIVQPERRSDWQAQVIDFAPYSGKPEAVDSTRLVVWKKEYRRWNEMERTTSILVQRLYATVSESDKTQRWFRVELEPQGPCETLVRINEVVRPKKYSERFWFFTSYSEAQERLDLSLNALNRWLGETEPTCSAQSN